MRYFRCGVKLFLKEFSEESGHTRATQIPKPYNALGRTIAQRVNFLRNEQAVGSNPTIGFAEIPLIQAVSPTPSGFFIAFKL